MANNLCGPELTLPRDHPASLLAALRRARHRNGGAREIARDGDAAPLTYDRLVTGAYALASRLAGSSAPGRRLGLLLPTGTPALVAFFAAHAAGRVPVLFNYSADATTIGKACRLARVETVLTSRRFIQAAGFEDIEAELERWANVVHLEDLRRDMRRLDKLVGALQARLSLLAPSPAGADDPAAILFTSGTTGEPKGVALSHANILANIEQVRQHVSFDPDWVFFNAMPLFHSLGLVGGTLLPLLGGMSTVLHPSPLDKTRIPELIEQSGANVLVSTDTFARLYARSADAGALRGLRFVVLGGERVRDTTRRLLGEKTAADVVEGYGVTECAPVVAVNQPDANRPGTVGRPLPGIEIRLDEVPDIDVGRRLLVRGPNVMLGYLDPERDGEIVPLEDDWFDTGDLADVDDDGFIRMTGRVKRFAKIGAEMVSLEAVEDAADELWPDADHAVVAIEAADGGGERIVLVTDRRDADRQAFAARLGEREAAGAAVPRHVLVVDEVPLTATGEPRYEAVRRLARERLDGDAVARAS